MTQTLLTRDAIEANFLPQDPTQTVGWRVSDGLTPYPQALDFMQERAQNIHEGKAPECIWLVEHPPLYTAGTSAQKSDLLNPLFDVFEAGRGGEYTYHGPGQRVAYVMLNLKSRRADVRAFVAALETWIIRTLHHFNVKGERREDRVGVWVVRPDRPRSPNGTPAEDKIAAIGIRLRKWVSFHGIAINLEPNLEHYRGIVPCGIQDYGVTSLIDLGLPITMEDLDLALSSSFQEIFGKIHKEENC